MAINGTIMIYVADQWNVLKTHSQWNGKKSNKDERSAAAVFIGALKVSQDTIEELMLPLAAHCYNI